MTVNQVREFVETMSGLTFRDVNVTDVGNGPMFHAIAKFDDGRDKAISFPLSTPLDALGLMLRQINEGPGGPAA